MNNNDMTQLADYLGQMISQATVEMIRHTEGEDAATKAANNMRAIPLPGDDTESAGAEPAVPAWPTAPHVWWDGHVWVRVEGGDYDGPSDYWSAEHLNSTTDSIRNGALSFAREAVPVIPVPVAAWEAWRRSTAHRECHRTEIELMNATDTMAGW